MGENPVNLIINVVPTSMTFLLPVINYNSLDYRICLFGYFDLCV